MTKPSVIRSVHGIGLLALSLALAMAPAAQAQETGGPASDVVDQLPRDQEVSATVTDLAGWSSLPGTITAIRLR